MAWEALASAEAKFNPRILAGLDVAGAVVFRKRLQRHRLLDFLDRLSPCVVAMEACGGAHHIGRFCLKKGHEPRLMSPLYVRPYVKVHKNDDRDAEAMADPASMYSVFLWGGLICP